MLIGEFFGILWASFLSVSAIHNLALHSGVICGVIIIK